MFVGDFSNFPRRHDESVDLPEDALVAELHELEVALHVAEVAADLGDAAAHLVQDGRERRVDVHDDLQVVRKVLPSPASDVKQNSSRVLPCHFFLRFSSSKIWTR